MRNKYEEHIPLILTILMVSAFKIPYLSLPLCYSESQLFTDSIFSLKNNGIGTVFAGQAVQLPDLFSVLMGYFAKFLSDNTIILHAFTLIFSALTIIFAYKFGKFFFSIHAGVIAAVLVSVQNVFLSQTGMILPIMMLNALIITSLYCYFREKFIWCASLLSLAALTDILGALTAVFILVAYYKEKSNREWKISTNIALCLPVAIWFAYQIISITVCGKLSLREFDFNVMNFVDNLNFTFVSQLRIALTVLFLSTALITKFSEKVDFYALDIFKTTGFYFCFIMVGNSLFGNNESYNLLVITILAISAGCSLSIMNIKYYYKYLITCGLIITFALDAVFENNVNDSYLSFKDKVEVDKKTISILTEKIQPGEVIYCDNFFKMYLRHTSLGYISSDYDIMENHEISTEIPLEPQKIIAITKENSCPEGYKTVCKIRKNDYEIIIGRP